MTDKTPNKELLELHEKSAKLSIDIKLLVQKMQLKNQAAIEAMQDLKRILFG